MLDAELFGFRSASAYTRRFWLDFGAALEPLIAAKSSKKVLDLCTGVVLKPLKRGHDARRAGDRGRHQALQSEG